MQDTLIENYVKFLNLKCKVKKEYKSSFLLELTDENGTKMEIMRCFDDLIVYINGEKIGTFREDKERHTGKTIFVGAPEGYGGIY